MSKKAAKQTSKKELLGTRIGIRGMPYDHS
jgi:hypothetical protein